MKKFLNSFLAYILAACLVITTMALWWEFGDAQKEWENFKQLVGIKMEDTCTQ